MKKIVFLCIAFFFIAFCSCEKDNSINNNSQQTSEDIEAYCLENGWNEVTMWYTSPNEFDFSSSNLICSTSDHIQLNRTGIWNFANWSYDYQTLKLYSSFNDLIAANAPATNGFINEFTVDDEKFIIQHTFYPEVGGGGSYNGYVKIYMKRTDSNGRSTLKIYYKGCDW